VSRLAVDGELGSVFTANCLPFTTYFFFAATGAFTVIPAASITSF